MEEDKADNQNKGDNGIKYPVRHADIKKGEGNSMDLWNHQKRRKISSH